jgi:PAS domain S-box-containing protein
VQNARGFWRVGAQFLTGVLALAVLTFVCLRLQVHSSITVCLYLILVVLVSLADSFLSSVVVSLLATGCLDYYFVPPLHSFEVGEPLNQLAVVAFLTASAVVTVLASRLHKARRESYADMASRRRAEEALRRSEAYLADAQGLSHTGSFGWRVGTNEIVWSAETSRIFEYAPTEKATLERIVERVHPEDAPAMRQTIERAAREGEDFEHHYRLQMPDGSVKYLHVAAHAQSDAAGGIEFVGAVMDETAAKQAEEALRRSEQQWRDVFENNPTMYFMVDAHGTIMAVNPFGAEQLGHKVDELVGQPVLQLFFDADREAAQSRAAQCLQHLGQSMNWELRKVRKDGEVLWVRETARAVLRGNQPVVLIACEDITERKSAEEKIRQQEIEIRQIIEFVPQHVAVLGPDRSRLYINQAALNYHGMALEQWRDTDRHILQAPHSFVHPDDWSRMVTETEDKFLSGTPHQTELRLLRKDGAYRWFLFRYNPMRDAQGNIQRWYIAATDIEDLKQAEQRLRQSEAYLAEAQKLSHTGSWAGTPAANQITYWSEECYRVLGFDPHAGPPHFETFFQRIYPEDRALVAEMMERSLREKTMSAFDFRIIHPSGEIRDTVAHPILSPSGELIESVGTVIDITERKRAEEERERLRQAQADLARVSRMTTMGELTASLAHEVNQPIAATITNASACLRWLTRDPPELEEAREAASRMLESGKRATEIVKRVRRLFEKGPALREQVDLNEVIREIIALLHGEATQHSIAVRAVLEEGLPRVIGDHLQLQQVLMNLMLNGIDAMKGVERTRELVISSQRDGKDQVTVSVSDTGAGLRPNEASQIFEPFFTTKAHGTGMGLSISRSIVESHDGRLFAADNSPCGASFCITLPVTVQAEATD